MAELNVKLKGNDVIITVKNGLKDEFTFQIIKQLLMSHSEEPGKEEMKISQEIYTEVEETYFLDGGIYDGLTAEDALEKDGLLALNMLYMYYGAYSHLNYVAEKNAIKLAIKNYIIKVVPDGEYDCTKTTLTDCISLLKNNEQYVFKKYLEKIYDQAKVKNLEELIALGENTVKGALTCCMNKLYQSVIQ